MNKHLWGSRARMQDWAHGEVELQYWSSGSVDGSCGEVWNSNDLSELSCFGPKWSGPYTPMLISHWIWTALGKAWHWVKWLFASDEVPENTAREGFLLTALLAVRASCFLKGNLDNTSLCSPQATLVQLLDFLLLHIHLGSSSSNILVGSYPGGKLEEG